MTPRVIACAYICSTKEGKRMLSKNTIHCLQMLQRLSSTDKKEVEFVLGRDSVIQEAVF